MTILPLPPEKVMEYLNQQYGLAHDNVRHWLSMMRAAERGIERAECAHPLWFVGDSHLSGSMKMTCTQCDFVKEVKLAVG